MFTVIVIPAQLVPCNKGLSKFYNLYLNRLKIPKAENRTMYLKMNGNDFPVWQVLICDKPITQSVTEIAKVLAVKDRLSLAIPLQWGHVTQVE